MRCPIVLPVADLPGVLKNQILKVIRAFLFQINSSFASTSEKKLLKQYMCQGGKNCTKPCFQNKNKKIAKKC